MLEFRPQTHQYLLNGTPCPSVTQALGEFVKVERGEYSYFVSTFNGNAINADLFDAAADHGTAVHEAARIILTHGPDALDWEALHVDLVEPLNQILVWRPIFGRETAIIEQPMYSPKLNVAGTPDLIIPGDKVTQIFDFKTGAYDLAGPQLAAYEAIYREQYGIRINHRIERYVIHLPKDGSRYKVIPMKDATDIHFFKSRLYQWQWLSNRRGK